MSGKTERTVKKLFDYQNSRSEQMIKVAEVCGKELSDEDLSLVSAAGDITEDFTKQVRIKTNYKLNDE